MTDPAAPLSTARSTFGVGQSVGGIVVGVLFMYQIKSLLDDFDFDPGFGDVVGVGAYVALIGGAVALVGGIMSMRST